MLIRKIIMYKYIFFIIALQLHVLGNWIGPSKPEDLDYFSNQAILIETWKVSISTSELYSDKPSGNFFILVGKLIYDWKA